MKKLLLLALAAAMILTLAACGGTSAPANSGGDIPDEEDVSHQSIDVSDCDTFTQIVDKKLSDGMGYANVNIDGTDVLLVSGGVFNNNPDEGDPFWAAVDSEIYFYDEDGSIGFMGYVTAGGTAYPLALGDGKLFAGRNHGMTIYTVDPELGVVLIDNQAWIEFDKEGNESYYHSSDISGALGDEGKLEDDSVLLSYLQEYSEAEVIEFSRVEK